MEKTKQVAYNHENPEEGFIETLTCPIDSVSARVWEYRDIYNNIS